MRIIPAGIEWKPVRRNHWLVTIRRTPEIVYDLADYGQAPSALQMQNMQMAASNGLGVAIGYRCPCCGSPYGRGFGNALGNALGGLGGLGL
jgi:hypothetical protein